MKFILQKNNINFTAARIRLGWAGHGVVRTDQSGQEEQVQFARDRTWRAGVSHRQNWEGIVLRAVQDEQQPEWLPGYFC